MAATTSAEPLTSLIGDRMDMDGNSCFMAAVTVTASSWTTMLLRDLDRGNTGLSRPDASSATAALTLLHGREKSS